MATILKRVGSRPPKRKYSGIRLKDALPLIPAKDFTEWTLNIVPLAVSPVLSHNLVRLGSFDLVQSEAAKITLIDTIFLEIVPNHPKLKVWKTELLETDTLTGFADYLIAPKQAYVETPLLCVTAAKRDDFEQGEAQCVAEMVACRWNNSKAGLEIPVYGIVSNGTGWYFYCLAIDKAIYKSGLFATNDLPELLGAIDYICGECAKNVRPGLFDGHTHAPACERIGEDMPGL